MKSWFAPVMMDGWAVLTVDPPESAMWAHGEEAPGDTILIYDTISPSSGRAEPQL